MARILLLRHGSTEPMNRVLCGRTAGIPLSERGRAEASALANRIRRLDALVSSPIERAMETAKCVSSKVHLPIQMDDRFLEFDFGDWTGKSFDELSRDLHWQRFNEVREEVTAPGGESMLDVQRRALAGVNAHVTNADDRTVAIVSHGDVVRALLLWASANSIHQYRRLTVDPASISEIEWTRDELRILRMNDCAHLESLAL